MTDAADPELTVLAAEFPGWRFGAAWQAAGSGPEPRYLTARRDGVLLSAQDAAGLRELIREAGADPGGGRMTG